MSYSDSDSYSTSSHGHGSGGVAQRKYHKSSSSTVEEGSESFAFDRNPNDNDNNNNNDNNSDNDSDDDSDTYKSHPSYQTALAASYQTILTKHQISPTKKPNKLQGSQLKHPSKATIIKTLLDMVSATEGKLSDSYESLKTFHKQQRKLYEGFKLLRQKYDDLKIDSSTTLWEFVPLNVKGFNELVDKSNEGLTIFETEKRIGEYRIGEIIGEGQFADVKIATLPYGSGGSARGGIGTEPNSPVTFTSFGDGNGNGNGNGSGSGNGRSLSPTSSTGSAAVAGKERQFACKIMRKDKVHTVANLKRVQNEISVLKCSRHPNIIQFHDVIFSSKIVYLFVELGGRDLFEFFDKHLDGVNDDVAMEIMLGITLPIIYLHSMGICHRDLKPENILLLDDVRSGDNGENRRRGDSLGAAGVHRSQIKICDFGLCCDSVRPKTKTLSDFCGSPGFFAPEMILSNHPGNKSARSRSNSYEAITAGNSNTNGNDDNDIAGLYNGLLVDVWSIGCMMLELTFGHQEFCKRWMTAYDFEIIQMPSKFSTLISMAIRNLELERLHVGMRDFLKMSLVVDPADRASSRNLLDVSWFDGVRDECMHLIGDEGSSRYADDDNDGDGDGNDHHDDHDNFGDDFDLNENLSGQSYLEEVESNSTIGDGDGSSQRGGYADSNASTPSNRDNDYENQHNSNNSSSNRQRLTSPRYRNSPPPVKGRMSSIRAEAKRVHGGRARADSELERKAIAADCEPRPLHESMESVAEAKVGSNCESESERNSDSRDGRGRGGQSSASTSKPGFEFIDADGQAKIVQAAANLAIQSSNESNEDGNNAGEGKEKKYKSSFNVSSRARRRFSGEVSTNGVTAIASGTASASGSGSGGSNTNANPNNLSVNTNVEPTNTKSSISRNPNNTSSNHREVSSPHPQTPPRGSSIDSTETGNSSGQVTLPPIEPSTPSMINANHNVRMSDQLFINCEPNGERIIHAPCSPIDPNYTGGGGGSSGGSGGSSSGGIFNTNKIVQRSGSSMSLTNTDSDPPTPRINNPNPNSKSNSRTGDSSPTAASSSTTGGSGAVSRSGINLGIGIPMTTSSSSSPKSDGVLSKGGSGSSRREGSNNGGGRREGVKTQLSFRGTMRNEMVGATPTAAEGRGRKNNWEEEEKS